MAKNKYYAVKRGRKPGIYETWDEAKVQVDNYPNALYKSFLDLKTAWKYLETAENSNITRTESKPNIDWTELEDPRNAVAFSDGSYDESDGSFSYGIALLWNQKLIRLSKRFINADYSNLRNVAGELAGARRAVQFAMRNDLKKITIYHDYEGVATLATREWDSHSPFTEDYLNFMKEAAKHIKIDFRWVRGHSGNFYNDMADKLAKTATTDEYREVEKLNERI